MQRRKLVVLEGMMSKGWRRNSGGKNRPNDNEIGGKLADSMAPCYICWIVLRTAQQNPVYIGYQQHKSTCDIFFWFNIKNEKYSHIFVSEMNKWMNLEQTVED